MNERAKSAGDSPLKREIDRDLKEALKRRDSLRLSVLRMLKSDIRYKEIERRSELSDDEIISVLSSSIKKRKDSIQQFEKGEREDLASREKAELEVISKYLPEQLTEEELSNIISQAIEEAGATGPSNLGMVMKEVMPKIKGRADGKKVNQMVSSQLQKMSDAKTEMLGQEES
jgi:uncharacterized protein YqeY